MAGTRASPATRAPAVTAGQPAIPPIWKETLWPLDWLSLRVSPVYYGCGIPKGDGGAVVLVPGFMGTDAYLTELYLWLSRVGYRPYMSGIGLNAECPGRLTRRLLQTVERAQRETGRRVRIVGHSLGGVIGRRASLERPDLVSHLVYLGSPLQAAHTHPAVAAAVSMLYATLSLVSKQDSDCLTDHCRCGFVNDIASALPRSVHHAAIYTHRDSVVDWHDAQETDPRLNYEVGGTHIGLVYNPRVYRVLAGLLSGRLRS